MNGIIGTAIVLVVVVGIVALIIRSMIKSKKEGKSLQCGYDCAKCKGCQ